ncbi:MAG TPA: MBL fold metallo-hydrolase [Terriglobia bacterium]|nr:MBL fold metallo-hydrolase [Terriglobia bacterium]
MPNTDPNTNVSATQPPAVVVKFWGTRGSIATPGPGTMRYGGNTSCVEVRTGGTILMLDCGTGAREMGMALMKDFRGQPLDIHLFVSHTHWDHIQGFPFFVPAYFPGNRITIYSLRGADKSLEKIFTGQMDASYFPVELSDLKAHLEFVELQETVEIGPVKVAHIFINHPGMAASFRVDAGGKSVVYTTDHEPYSLLLGANDFNRDKDLQVTEFARGADLYIREAQYTDEEYPGKRGWGHSTFSEVLDAAQHAGVKRLALFHHDPMHDDNTLDHILAACHARMKERGMTFECFAATDNQQIIL